MAAAAVSKNQEIAISLQ